MRRASLVSACLAVVLILPTVASAQFYKYAVFVSQTGSDAVGVGTAFQLKEAIQKSASYELAATAEDADVAIIMVSMAVPVPDEILALFPELGPRERQNLTQQNHWSGIGYSIVFDPPGVRMFLNSSLILVGRDRTEPQAGKILADADRVISAYRAAKKIF